MDEKTEKLSTQVCRVLISFYKQGEAIQGVCGVLMGLFVLSKLILVLRK